MHNAYNIIVAITALFMHETINGRDISDETRFSFYDTWSIDLYQQMARDSVFICLFFRKKVGHFDLNDATPQHPF